LGSSCVGSYSLEQPAGKFAPLLLAMSAESKAAAQAAKERGNAAFAKKGRENLEEALKAYEEGISLDPDNPILHSNVCACHLELASDHWEPRKKVESTARGLLAARKCTALDPTWVKGYVRQATAEFDLVNAAVKWAERQKQDEKWAHEDEERALKDEKEGRKPFRSHREPQPELDPALKDVVNGASHSSCEESCRNGLKNEPGNALLRSKLQALRDAGYITNEEQDKALVDEEAASKHKAQGNTNFSAKKWQDAVDCYTKAMEQNPFDHVFFSNRSACYAELEEFEKALKDADRCVALNPNFAKGYSRQAHALFHVGRYVEMEAAARKGLTLDPASKPLEDLLKQAQTETAEPLAVQQKMHQLRQEKRQDAKLQDLMRGLNMQGNNIQMFNPGAGGDLSGLLSSLGGGGGGSFGGGSGKSRMTEEQMRGMARAMGQAPTPTAGGYPAATAPATPAATVSPSTKDSSTEGPNPKAFAPK